MLGFMFCIILCELLVRDDYSHGAENWQIDNEKHVGN